PGELFKLLRQERSEREEVTRARGRRRLAPGRKRVLRRLDGRIDVRGRRHRRLGNHRPECRIVYIEILQALRRDPPTADKIVESLDVAARSRSRRGSSGGGWIGHGALPCVWVKNSHYTAG